MIERYGDFAALLGQGTEDETEIKSLRKSEKTGRSLGSEEWIQEVEKMTGTVLKPQKRGPKKRERNND